MPDQTKSLANQYRKPTQSRSKFTVNAILEAATYILIEKGLGGTTTNEVAERAGVSVSSLYQYFPNKHALVAAITERHLNEMSAMIAQGLSEYIQSPIEEMLRALVTLVFEAHAIQPELHHILIGENSSHSEIKEIAEFEERIHLLIISYLKSKESELNIKDLEIATFILMNTIETLTHRAALERTIIKDKKERLIDEITRLLINYLTTEH